MTLRQRQHWSEIEQRGDYIFARRLNGSPVVIMHCPFCDGRPIGAIWPEHEFTTVNHVVVSESPLTILPSVVCPFSGCHFYITNGEVEKC